MPATVARLTCDESTARRVAAMVGESLPDDTACSAFENSAGTWAVEIFFHDEPDRAAIAGLVATAGANADALSYDIIPDRDWIASSLAGLNPVDAGRFVVHGAHDRDTVAPNAIGIEIEAALAFGTGHHGTTRGCLVALDRVAKRRTFANVLDVGTGSGVLAIAAARAFRSRVMATDIDGISVRAAGANARLNRASGYITTLQADGCRRRAIRIRAPYELIFANILLGPLCRMASSLASLAGPGATVVLSGLLPAHAHAALAAYRAQGLVLERRLQLDSWTTLILRKPGKRKPPRR